MKLNLKLLKNKNILVTGGAGFIGSNLCEYLVNLNANVKCLDNLSTGYLKNIKNLISKPNFEFIKGDIYDYNICDKSTKGIDYVLHQAALGSVPRSVKDPISSNKNNVDGFLNILVASKNNNVKRFVYASSSSLYGDSKDLPKVENIIGNPLSPYAINKFTNELYAMNFKKIYNFNSIGLRYFNVFGRRQDPDGSYAAVIPKFIKKLINYESPLINGDGTFSRDFTYIDNIIQINICSILTNNNFALNQVYNAAYGERTSILDLVKYLKNYLSHFDSKILKINPIHGPKRAGDIPHSLASIEKAKKNLNYLPLYSFKLGIEKSINWYWENLKK